MSTTADNPTPPAPLARGGRDGLSLIAEGQMMVWLTGGGFVISLTMIICLVGLIIWKGSTTFWPAPVTQLTLLDGRVFAGEVTRDEIYTPRESEIEALGSDHAPAAQAALKEAGGESRRRLLRTGNFDVSGSHFNWVSQFQIKVETKPDWILVVERLSWGRFYGEPARMLIDGVAVAETPESVWSAFREHHDARRDAWRKQVHIERHALGALNRQLEAARLESRRIESKHGSGSPQHTAALASAQSLSETLAPEYAAFQSQIDAIKAEDARFDLVLRTADGTEKSFRLSEIVRIYPANRLDRADKLGIYISRWKEFLFDEPREANSEGGVFPAIFGTVTMTLLMSIAVVPFGIMAALYMREYARGGLVISAVRIAVNNLAGVPSIVFGVFGLGFFCYFVGGGIDNLFYKERLPSPTFGTGGIMWASLTLALLTLPVVIVATEEALAAVPRSMREGSYGCGASKWQTIWRIVLPRAMPGIMTGAILAMARGAGEVAPLMLVGAVKLAPELPIDGVSPFIHPERSFMHLGFHIYDLGFQSQNSEAAKPMVFTTTLLLILIIVTLNLAAIWLRARLSRRFRASQF
ncbi:MAG: phosphate ABC transporter permease PstA [Phycisphaeraceae bacterium]|nr:phosphate ABC transporter permease PstA [Phycisphaeraceae bacterium]